MAGVFDCLLHPIDCEREARGASIVVDTSTPDAQRAALLATRDLPADDPRRIAAEEQVRAARTEPTFAQRLGLGDNPLGDIQSTTMWTSIAIVAIVIVVLVVMFAVIHFTNRI